MFSSKLSKIDAVVVPLDFPDLPLVLFLLPLLLLARSLIAIASKMSAREDDVVGRGDGACCCCCSCLSIASQSIAPILSSSPNRLRLLRDLAVEGLLDDAVDVRPLMEIEVC
ncbi:hypothetical protein G6F42_028634 [Rhizopus arrhizus]|nr:hypothetical protein G6F42_028634 [Rhizopus arrhizus]